MEIADPRIDPRLVPEGSKAVVIAEHQDEYQDLPSVRTPNGYVITRWSLTDDERRRILEGEDVYITLLSLGGINPLFATVGPVDWTAGGVIYITSVDGRRITLSCGHLFDIYGAQLAVGEPFACQLCRAPK